MASGKFEYCEIIVWADRVHNVFWLSAGIRRLQVILLKISLLLGVQVHPQCTFAKLVEPIEGEFHRTARLHSSTSEGGWGRGVCLFSPRDCGNHLSSLPRKSQNLDFYSGSPLFVYVTLHRKTRNKVITRAQHANMLWHWHNTLSVLNICA